MMFIARYVANELAEIHMEGRAFDPEAEFSRGLLDGAISSFLTFDDASGIIRLMPREGVATYRVTSVDPLRDVVTASLESVETGACAVCSRENGKHHYWCTRAVY